ncbi:MAG: arsenosugar biosynthesis radical SAM protein ArsS [Gammaproteobacteria bacterium]|nr:arsenosugar biosynthesis radical SAM protein ArsS [Gammaproteobacteria bacterium]
MLFPTDFPSLERRSIQTLQVNLGLKCNQSCIHCHVDAGPKRTEMMSDEVLGQVVEYLINHKPETLDLTGGAPEIHPLFRQLVLTAVEQGVHVIDRCNLTILSEPDQADLAKFLAENKVEVIASLPCYLEENVDGQRGKGVFDKSMHGLKQLNDLGYGQADSSLQLNLVYNPVGAYLPPPQQSLEDDYKRQLNERFGIQFNSLFTITNMPIQRFGSYLQSKNEFANYLQLLKQAYQEQNLETVMCRDLVSIDWQGFVYDCDFNQMLAMKINDGEKSLHISDLNENALIDKRIVIGEHCYGCTAGQGSSCGGALT